MRLILNGIEADGITGDVVMSFVSNNLRDISNRNSNYSNNFNLAITNKNREIFGSAELVVSGTDVPYRKLSAQIIVDGLVVVDGFAILNSSKEFYSLNVFSGGIDFIQAIKEFDLQNIRSEIDELDHTNLISSINERRFNKTDIVYPNIDYGYFERYEQSLSSVPQRFFFPAIYTKWILDRVFKNIGYNYTGNLFQGEIWNNLVLPCYNIQDVSIFEVDYGVNIQQGDLSGEESYISFVTQNIDLNNSYQEINIPTIGDVYAYNLSNYTSGDLFALECSGVINYTVGSLFGIESPYLTVFLDIINKTTGALKGSVFQIEYPSSNLQSFDFVAYSFSNLGLINSVTDVLVWRFKSQGGNGLFIGVNLSVLRTEGDISFNLKQYKSEGTVFVRIYKSLPDFKVGDLLKAILNIEGAFLRIDDSTKQIQAFYYDDIRNNKVKSYDWSNLIDLSEEPEVTYRFNEYAQESVFTYTNDDKDIFLSEEFGQGAILVNDQTLDLRKEVTKVPFSLCDISPTADNRLSMGKIYTGEKWIKDDSGDYEIDEDAKINNFKPRLVQLTDSSSQIYIAVQVIQSRDVINNTTFDKVIARRYGTIADVLNKTKVVNALFRLSVNEVYNLDYSIPVYISYFNEYFFINEVKQFNFTKKQSTIVELIRI